MKVIKLIFLFFTLQALASTRDRLKKKLENREKAKQTLLEELKAYEIKLKIDLPSIIVKNMKMEEKLNSLLNPTFVHSFDIRSSENMAAELNFEGFSVITFRYTSLRPPPENICDLIRSNLTKKEVEKCFIEHLPLVAKDKGYRGLVKRALKSILVSHKECEDSMDYKPTERSERHVFPHLSFPMVYMNPSGHVVRPSTLNEMKFMPIQFAFALCFDIDPSQFEVRIEPSETDEGVLKYTMIFKAPVPRNIEEKSAVLFSILKYTTYLKALKSIKRMWQRYLFSKRLPQWKRSFFNELKKQLTQEFRLEEDLESTFTCPVCQEEKLFYFQCPEKHLICGQCFEQWSKTCPIKSCPICRSPTMKVSSRLNKFLEKNYC